MEDVGRVGVNTDDFEALLHRSVLDISGIAAEFGRRGDAAFVLFRRADDPDRWAVVSSPGSRWFSVEVDGGYSFDRFDEDVPDDEIENLVVRLIEIAQSSLTPDQVRLGRDHGFSPVVVVRTAHGTYELRRSIARNIKELFRRKWT